MKLLLLTLLAVACTADKLAHNQAVPESAQSAGGDEFLISPRSYEQPKYPYKPPNYIIPKPPSNNNYVPPQNNYVPPQNNYVQPQNDNYYPPQNNYVQPQNEHNYPPQNNYVQPQNDHNYPPQNNYIPPQNNYIPPQNNYIPPVNNYVPPVNNYVPPQNNYIPPKNDYVTAAPQADYPLQYPQQPVTPPVPILQSSSIQNIDGSFKYEYLTGDNTYVEQEGHVENAGTDNEIQVVTGSYSYVGPDGKTYKVTYIADGNGFRATGDHLPTPPPIPKAIQASLDKNAAEEAAAAAAAAAAQQGGGPWAGSQTNYPNNQNYNPGQYVPPNNNYNPNYVYPPQNNQNWQQPYNIKKPY